MGQAHRPADSIGGTSMILPNLIGMFTTYAIDLNTQQDTQARAETLEEALAHLRELVASEIEDPAGPRFDRYGITIDKEAFAHARYEGLSSDACDSAAWLVKKHDVDAAFALGTLAEILANQLYDVWDEARPKHSDGTADFGHIDLTATEDEREAHIAESRRLARKEAAAAKRKCLMIKMIRTMEAAHHKLQAEVLERQADEDFSQSWADRARKQAKAAGMILVLLKHALECEYQGLAGGDDDDEGDEE